MIVKHEALADLLEKLDIEAIEEQSTDIHTLHDELNDIKKVSNQVVEELNAMAHSVTVVSGLETIFSKIAKYIV